MVAAHACNEEIRPAIVIVVPRRNTHSVERNIESRPRRYVLEMSFAVVSIQRHGGSFLSFALVPGPIRGIDEEQVLVAVIVEIQKSHPAAHGFREQLVPIGAVVMREPNSRFGRDIPEWIGR